MFLFFSFFFFFLYFFPYFFFLFFLFSKLVGYFSLSCNCLQPSLGRKLLSSENCLISLTVSNWVWDLNPKAQLKLRGVCTTAEVFLMVSLNTQNKFPSYPSSSSPDGCEEMICQQGVNKYTIDFWKGIINNSAWSLHCTYFEINKGLWCQELSIRLL